MNESLPMKFSIPDLPENQISIEESLIDLTSMHENFVEIVPDIRLSLVKTVSADGSGKLLSSLKESFTSSGRTRLGAILASVLGASVVKVASKLAFQEKGRSMTSPDVLEALGKAFQQITADDIS